MASAQSESAGIAARAQPRAIGMLCGQKALLVAVLGVRLRLGFSPTTSLSPKWRAYMAGLRRRQARRNGFLIDFVADFLRRTIDSFLTLSPRRAQFSVTICWGSARVSTQSSLAR